MTQLLGTWGSASLFTWHFDLTAPGRLTKKPLINIPERRAISHAGAIDATSARQHRYAAFPNSRCFISRRKMQNRKQIWISQTTKTRLEWSVYGLGWKWNSMTKHEWNDDSRSLLLIFYLTVWARLCILDHFGVCRKYVYTSNPTFTITSDKSVVSLVVCLSWSCNDRNMSIHSPAFVKFRWEMK